MGDWTEGILCDFEKGKVDWRQNEYNDAKEDRILASMLQVNREAGRCVHVASYISIVG